MVDNGTQHKFATEIAFRSNLEKTISEEKTESGKICVTHTEYNEMSTQHTMDYACFSIH